MIISKAPFRVSFVGGGTDIPEFYRQHGGAVVSTAVDKYVFVTVNRKFDNGIRVSYSRTEEVANVAEIDHRIVRATLQELKIDGGVELTTIADIPSRGTGLGSSSSFTVALLHALLAYRGKYVDSATLAAAACRIEIEVCGEPIGKQDQYAAAYGGLNLIEFLPDEAVKVSPIVSSAEAQNALQGQMLMLYTGITRSASSLLREQTQSIRSNANTRSTLKRMRDLAYVFQVELCKGNTDVIGEILHENWELKKSLTAGISTGQLDEWYATARSCGATGGKILGAGAGGFLMLLAPAARHESICRALPGLKRIPTRFERFGSQIIFYNPPQQPVEGEII
jgi:D-glycero-alpha-D-manno-heptose-7-phosphate kinase